MVSTRSLVARATLVALAAALAPASALASTSVPPAHGHTIQVVTPGLSGRGASAKAANETYNWFGYELDAFAHPGQTYYSIAGMWTVPVASQHAPGEAEASSDWVGIGGSCLNSNCTTTDSTLIQTGTEQDVDSSGHPSYYAWWEGLPAYEQPIAGFSVSPGDQMSASLSSTVGSNVWTISLRDLTTGESYTNQVVYSSAYTSAEWIEEATTVAQNGTSYMALPNLSTIPFSQEAVNGASADLSTAAEDLLVDQSGDVIGTPSTVEGDVFDECAWASTCATPTIPASVAPPAISGNPVAGQTLTESHGSWTGAPSRFNYQWLRCDASGNACQAVSGATSQTYTLSSPDVGHTMRVEESASNAVGAAAPVASSSTAVIAGLPTIQVADAKRELRKALRARYRGAFVHRYRYTTHCTKTSSETVACHVSWRHRGARFAGRVTIRWYLENGNRSWKASIKVRRSRAG